MRLAMLVLTTAALLLAGCSSSNTTTGTTKLPVMPGQAHNATAPALTFTKAVAAYCNQCDAGLPSPAPSTPGACAGWEQGMQGLDCVWVAVPANLAGHHFNATGDAGQDIDLAFVGSCTASPTAMSLADFNAAGTTEAGTVPNGAGCVILWNTPAVPPAPGPGASTLVISIS